MYYLPKLPFLYQDLEPFIDTHTIGLHYNKHHTNYVKNLNALLLKNNNNNSNNINELLSQLNNYSKEDRENILFNLGGYLNHNLYWKSINSPDKRQLPTGKLDEAIMKKYGDYQKFWNILKEKALLIKGSGYTSLVIRNDKTLDIINTKNQELPQLDGNIPLFTIDMWEHAYYLNYANDKAKYIDNLEPIADFTYANELYNKIQKTE